MASSKAVAPFVSRRVFTPASAGAFAKETALLAALAGRIYDHAPQQNAVPVDGFDHMRVYAAACALIVCLGCERAAQSRADTVTRSPAPTQCGMVASESDTTCILFDPSMIALIAQPAQYHARRVRTIGFVNLEFEGNAIYVGREDYAQGLSRNALWLGVADSMARPYRKQLPGYFLVEGTFSSSDHGHMGMFSGAINHVTRFEPWRSRAQVDSMARKIR